MISNNDNTVTISVTTNPIAAKNSLNNTNNNQFMPSSQNYHAEQTNASKIYLSVQRNGCKP